jgi:uridylate kinase
MQAHKNDLTPSTIVLSVGGSLVVPNGHIDTDFLSQFHDLIVRHVARGWRFVIVIGGGGTARAYQNAAKEITDLTRDDLDWLGIHSTRLNGHLVRTVFRDVAHPVMVTDPTNLEEAWERPVLVAAGWRPGWSTDFVATRLAKELGIGTVINLSDVDMLYTADPRKDPSAEPIPQIAWEGFRRIVGDTWDPGMNVPFDPVASRLAHEEGIRVILAHGKKLDNLEALFGGEDFVGTIVE